MPMGMHVHMYHLTQKSCYSPGSDHVTCREAAPEFNARTSDSKLCAHSSPSHALIFYSASADVTTLQWFSYVLSHLLPR